jgi:hypothetical protein
VQIEDPPIEYLLSNTAVFLWHEWPKDMFVSSVHQTGFTLTGTCPHCDAKAAFPTVGTAFDELNSGGGAKRSIAVGRCISCREYILGIIKHVIEQNQYVWVYEAHYPLGKPDDNVSTSIPEDIRLDFQEALRCRFVDAYNATIEMCRRSIESSCIEQGADKKLVLNDMIDWVHSKGKITTPLKDMAHKIKLGGNRAAHPSDKTLTKNDADGVLEFTKEYFQHVYVMPAKMALYDFEKPKKDK